MEESSNILPSDTIPDDSGVTSHQHTCEENQNEKTEEVPHEQSITDTNKASSHDSVLRQECVFSSEKPKAELDLKTSSKIEMQNDKGLCDNGRESDKEVASDRLQRTCRQDMSHPSPDDEKEEYKIPPCDTIPDDSGVTSQHNTCEEDQNEKSEEVPHQQSNTDTNKASPHKSVLHQECDSSSEKTKGEHDLKSSLKTEPPQNGKGLCDNGGKGDKEVASDGLQGTHRQDTSHPSPDVEMEESSNILPSDTIPDDSGVTSHQHTCEENQNEKTEEVPHEQSITDTNKASSHDSVLRQECVFSSEKPKAELDLKTSSKIEMQNDKGLCDNGRESDKEVASDGLQRTCRQDMSHPSPDDEKEEYKIPPCDTIPDDSGVTSQHNTCEEDQNEKSEEVPHQQSNTDTNKASPHESVLHQECDSSSEKTKGEHDLKSSLKTEPPQNGKGLCDNGGKGDKEVASDGLQGTHRQDTSHPSPDVEMEESSNILPSDTIPDDSGVTSHQHTCEENQNEKTEEVPHEQSITDTNKASSHDSVLRQECVFSSEKPKAELDLKTSSKIEMQNDKGLCDNGRESDKEVASDGLQRTCRQDMSHPSPDDEKEEYKIPPCDTIPDDSGVTSQHNTCEEDQNEKSEEVPHQQSNTDTNKASPHESVLHQECDSSSEKTKGEHDLKSSLKTEPPQNGKGLCDNGGKGDKEVASDGLQGTHRQDTSHPSPDVEMEESSNILPSDTIPDDSGVTSHQHTCEENQNEKTEEVPHEQSITDTNKASSHDSVLRQECVFSSEKPKAELDLKTSSKIEMQNDKGLCDNGRESDKEVASDGLQRTCRQDMSHPSPDDEKEEYKIPPCDTIPDDSGVTSQHNTCEEDQNEKSEEVPHQQSNTDTNKASPHERVLHQECDSSSEKTKGEHDLKSSLKTEPPQNDKGLCDNGGKGDKEVASDGLQGTHRQVRFMFT
ncbi:uncharacterized protein LOC143925164 [Lithobates pipiens]